jgi:hypothetical protein
MKPLSILLAVALIAACSKPQFGSDCTTSQIKIENSRSQPSATALVEPFLLTRSKGVMITVGRYDAYRIISARSKENPTIARAVSLLRPLLAQQPTNGKATDIAQIHPNLIALEGEDLADGVLVSNELEVIFVTALSEGVAQIVPAPTAPITLVQHYTADAPEGSVSGVRIMLSGKRIYDYCGITPPMP